jgi:UDP-GlcNAc3NAcA epimerase
MYDVALHFAALAVQRETVLGELGVTPKRYVLATCHRAENTDSPEKLRGIAAGLGILARSRAVVFPVHPRTKAKIVEYGCVSLLGAVTVIDPVSYLDMVALERNAEIIVTDSGGVQKEAFFYRVPCVTVRDETEWVETVTTGWNALAGSEPDDIVRAVEQHTAKERREAHPYGAGDAAERIVAVLMNAS